jgi:multidrug efflux system membrane fusion protein
MTLRRWTKLGLACIAIALIAGGLSFWFQPDPAPALPPPAPVPVVAATVQQQDVPIVLTGLGTVTALNTATVRSQVTGQLTSVDFTEGQSVKKGDLLAQIDPRTFQAQLDQAQAALTRDQTHLANAAANLGRFSALLAKGYSPQKQVADQQAAVAELQSQIKADRAAIDQARAELSYTALAAPFDGVTGLRLLDVGNVIHPTDPNGLVVVTQVQPISVVFTLAATDIPAVQDALAKGPVQAIAFSQDGKTELDSGRLLLVDNQADPSSGTVRLKALFPNLQRRLWPGTFVNVRVVTAMEHGGLTAPLDAVQQGPQGGFVFVVGPDRKVAVRPVSVRQSLDGTALIERGLSAHEQVVVRGQYRLSPGVLVSFADPNDAAAVPSPSTASSGMLP